MVKQCCATDGVEPQYIKDDILPPFFKHFWNQRMALDRRNYRQVIYFSSIITYAGLPLLGITVGIMLPYKSKIKRAGLSRSGKNIWKTKFFPGQGKVRKFCGWPGKFRKDLQSQGILKINGYGRKSSENSFILFKKGKGVL